MNNTLSGWLNYHSKKSLQENTVINEKRVITDGKTYGGKGEFVLPDSHRAGMEVPKGGSMCGNCEYLSDDGTHCRNEHFVKWNGGNPELPVPADEFCSDWWEPKDGTEK